MIGGEPEPVAAPRPDLQDDRARASRAHPRTPGRSGEPSPAEQGYLHCGPAGAGHFVKMVHNGIEYGLMAAYAEGLNVLRHANVGKQDGRAERRRDGAAARPAVLPVRHRRRRGRRGLAARQRRRLVAARPDRRARWRSRPTSTSSRGRVSDSGEGRWTVHAAIDEGVPGQRARRRRSTSASARAARPTSPTSCCRRCASSSAATSRSPADWTLSRAAATRGRHRSTAAAVPVPDDHVIVLFGATGDLAQRKLLPGLFHLERGRPDAGRASGSSVRSRTRLSDDEFRALARDGRRRVRPHAADGGALGAVRERALSYVGIGDGLDALAEAVAEAQARDRRRRRACCTTSSVPPSRVGRHRRGARSDRPERAARA